MQMEPLSEPGRLRSLKQLEASLPVLFDKAALRSSYHTYLKMHHRDLADKIRDPHDAWKFIGFVFGAGIFLNPGVWGGILSTGALAFKALAVIGFVGAVFASYMGRKTSRSVLREMGNIAPQLGDLDCDGKAFEPVDDLRFAVNKLISHAPTHVRLSLIIDEITNHNTQASEGIRLGMSIEAYDHAHTALKELIAFCSYAHQMNTAEKQELDHKFDQLEMCLGMDKGISKELQTQTA